MKRFILGLFFIIIANGFVNENLFAEDIYLINSVTPQFVRVGISDNSFSNYLFDRISFTSEGDFVVSDNSTAEYEFKAGEIANIQYYKGIFEVFKDTKPVLKMENKPYISSVNGKPIGIVGLKRKGKQALYSGSIELEAGITKPDKFAVVNVLPLQQYLKGVVPNEMPTNFGLEALKAQAVLARNYVLKPRESYYKEFGICDSTACQVYFGANTQESLSDKAVDETENIVVLYDNDLILAVYSSTAGGHTESYKNVFMQNMSGRIMSPNVPYLIGKSDNHDIPKNLENEEKMREFYSSAPETFDNDSPYFRWKREWQIKELENILSKNIKSVKNTGFVRTKRDVDYNDNNYFGHLKSININKRGVSGKVVALTLVTDTNEFTLYKELIIRKVFQNNGKMLPSANVFFDIEQDENTKEYKVIATGGGLGHGVGMSQWGAGAMAKKGYKYDDIIHHYYTDVNLALKPVGIKSDMPFTIEFFVENNKSAKNSVLRLDNNFHFSELNIIINGKYLENNMKNKLTKDGKIPIGNYLKKGKNIVTYELKSNNTSKEAKFWIELE